ncbi:MAG: bifunctional methylenetetrahydrofolate dehydrogenase/methenyltetrahydrofolate cyclohydrolase FolD [Ruminococcus sp.]|nr:bifunctional methylenetetrahydrofolate dehydrogenase/methenyltetrahydrofolate cyclohydrolase FolD [Ruminococcus sp.]
MYQVLDGKLVSQSVKDRVRVRAAAHNAKGEEITLAVIIVGDDPASRVYVNNKKKACEYVGFRSLEYALPASTTQEELIELIHELNERRDVHGILCQLPVPKHIDDKAVIAAIDPKKDVDAFSEINVGKILIGKYDLLPCTPAGVMELLDYYDIKVEGRNCVVIGRSNIVGKPMAVLLMHANGTVTVTHKKTRHLREVTNKADILVSSVGRAKFVTADMVKEGAVVVDVGMNRDENGKLCGDVVFDEVAPKCSYITPVPGGVGPMTIAMLMQNTLKAFEIQQSDYEG